jgi:hypothetical protein
MAEPGAITDDERTDLLPVVDHAPWLRGFDLTLQRHYWRKNVRELCSYIWPNGTEANMGHYLGGSCTFWMSLPPKKQTAQLRREVQDYFLEVYLCRFISLFTNAVVLAAGGKAKARLQRLARLTQTPLAFEECRAFTKPESNKARAHDSWRLAGEAIKSKLAAR